MRIEIEEAENGWIIKSNESRREPKVFEFDGTNRFKTNLENIVMTAERALEHILKEMINSTAYKVKIVEDIEDVTKPDLCSAGPLSDQALCR
jgi:hypothetical protein